MSQQPPRLVKRKVQDTPLPGNTSIPRLRARLSAQEPAQQPLYSSELGTDEVTDQVLTLGDKERRSGLYLLGRTGMGKSTLLVNLALQDIEHGHGVFFLDPHEDAIRDILKRLPRSRKQDVLLFQVRDKTHSFGINPVACADPSDLDQREDTFVKAYEVFHSLWSTGRSEWGPWLELIVAYLLRALIENQGYTLAAAPAFLTDADFRRSLVATIQYNSQVAGFWQDQFAKLRSGEQGREIQAALTRVDQLLADPYVRHVIGQKKTTLDFSHLMKNRKIVLVSFPANLPSNTKRFLGTILIRELLWAARARRTDRSQFCVFVDEFQNFVTPDFASIVRETRKFGLAPTIAQQFSLGAEYLGVNEAIDAMANLVIFQPTVADAERKAKEFADRPKPAELELLSEESLTILQDESEERTMDEWEDGIEPIPTIAQSPLSELQKGHAFIGQLTSDFLKPLSAALALAQPETSETTIGLNRAVPETVYRETVDGIEYVATRQQLLRGRQLLDRLLFDLMQERLDPDSQVCISRMAEIANELRGYITFSPGAMWSENRSSWTEQYRSGRYRQSRTYSYGEGRWIDLPLPDETVACLEDLTGALVDEEASRLSDRRDATAERALVQAAEQFRQAILYINISWPYKETYDAVQKGGRLLPPPDYTKYEDRTQWLAGYEQELRKATETAIQKATQETKALVEFLRGLYELCVALSRPENRIMVPSGQYQMRKHQQPHYEHKSRLVLNHPRREMLHPQRPYSDMIAEKERDLLDLAPYTAAYKLLPPGGGAPIKGVLATFGLDDFYKEHEDYITHGLRRSIIAASHAKEYSLRREDIETEIQRQQRQSDTPEVQSGTQSPPAPEKRERQGERKRAGYETE